MIEGIVLEYLKNKLKVPVYMEVPEKPEKRYVIIEKTGASKKDHICSATLAIQSVAESLYEAALLNEQMKEQMESITDETEVSKCELNNDYNYTDTTTKKYRYQAVYDLVHY